MRRWDARRIVFFLVSLVGVLVAAAIVAGLGPEDAVVCGRGHVLNRLAQPVMEPLGAGHIDGPSTTKCVVPSTSAWLVAVAVFLLGTGSTIILMRRREVSSGTSPA